jgi:hypothetical protein
MVYRRRMERRFHLIKQRDILKRERRRSVERVIEEGWYCGANTYSEIIDAIESV